MDSVHRFTDPIYADLTLRLRAGDNPAHLFDRLHALRHVRLHRSTDDPHEDIAAATTAAIESRDAASVRTVSGVHSAQARAQRSRQHADRARADLTRIESLPIGRAVQFIESRRARALQVEVERTAATRNASLGVPTERRIGGVSTR